MTVSTTIRKQTFPGDGTAAVRNTTFPMYTSSELIVYSRVIATGVETQMLEDTNYTVALGATLPSTAAITPLAVIPVTDEWVAYRLTDLTQGLDYVTADDFPASAHEEGLDRGAMRSQEAYDLARRSLHASILDSDAELPLEIPRKAVRASQILGFDANGEPIAVDTTLFDSSGYAITAAGIAMIQGADAAAQRALVEAVHNRTGVADALDAGTLGAQPTAVAFGQGFYHATDTFELYYSNATTWTLVGIDQQLYASVAVTAGRLSIATDRKQLYRGNGATRDLIRAYSPNHLQGFQLTKATANTLTVGVGTARNLLPVANADEMNLRLASAMTKDIRATWVAGTGNGGMIASANPIAANTFVYVFVIGKDDGTTDICCDTSVTGANVTAGGSAPVVAGYTHARRIGQFKTTRGDASPNAVILDFTFNQGWYYYPDLYNAAGANSELDQLGGATGLEYVGTAQDFFAGVDIPLPRTPAFSVLARIIGHTMSGTLQITQGGVALAVPSLHTNDQWPLCTLQSGTVWSTDLCVMTDASKQIRIREYSGGNDDLNIALLGYFDYRDKE
jgi:hypothetical protein